MMQTHANERFEVSRELRTIGRPLAVWSAVSAGAWTAVTAVPGAWRAARTGPAYDEVEHLLVAACTVGLALALTWLWVITTITVTGLLTGGDGAGYRSGATRRLVLLACGAAVVAGTGAPAVAVGDDAREVLVGLALPERAVAPLPAHHRPPAGAEPTYVVRPGDSLWSIASDHPGDAGSVDQRWRAIWHLNHDVVGDDPDLIVPGQALRLPTNPDPTSDGDR